MELEYSIRFYSFFIRTFTSQTAKKAAKHVGKAALEAGKTVAVDAGKKPIDKAMQPKKKSRRYYV